MRRPPQVRFRAGLCCAAFALSGPVLTASNFGGRVGQIANQPVDQLLASADLVIIVGYDRVEYWPSWTIAITPSSSKMVDLTTIR
jgi:hypothetical protein